MMKLLVGLICLMIIFVSCDNANRKNEVTQNTSVKQLPPKQETAATEQAIKEQLATDAAKKPNTANHLALTSNALQLVNSEKGSTAEIAFGKPLDELVEIINKVLQDKVSSIGINSECGAGPLKMALWKNGLNLIFKEQKTDGLWQFVGWYVSQPKNNTKTLQTMAGIGIGSTREEMESAYVIKVTKSSLGYEFSTTSGLYGIFDGAGKNAKITDMWSGTTCIFR